MTVTQCSHLAKGCQSGAHSGSHSTYQHFHCFPNTISLCHAIETRGLSYIAPGTRSTQHPYPSEHSSTQGPHLSSGSQVHNLGVPTNIPLCSTTLSLYPTQSTRVGSKCFMHPLSHRAQVDNHPDRVTHGPQGEHGDIFSVNAKFAKKKNPAFFRAVKLFRNSG